MRDLIVLIGVVASATAGAAASGGMFARQGEWTCHLAKDGSSEAVLGVVSNQNNGMLLVRCSSGRPSLSVKWSAYASASSRPTSVTTRLDQGEPVLGWWPASTIRREADYPGDDAAYLRDLRRARTLVLRVTPYPVPAADAGADGRIYDASPNAIQPAMEPPLEMTFNLSGLEAAIVQAQGACEPR